MRTVYPIDSIMAWNDNEVTDHGRGELSVSSEQLKHENRMVDGTLRRYYVASKRTWSTSWDNLFSKDAMLADGFWGGESMLSFYKNTPGDFWLTITSGDGRKERVRVMFSSFEYSINKRGNGELGDLWTASCEMVEV